MTKSSSPSAVNADGRPTRRSQSTALAVGSILSAAAALSGCGGGDSTPAPPEVPQASALSLCNAFLGRSFEGATVTASTLVPAAGSVPEYCLVSGAMPQQLAFEVRMPTNWNHRTVFVGGGGFDGYIQPPQSPNVLERGYATIATNHGHNNPDFGPETWALDQEMLTEYAYLAVPRVLAPAKAILTSRYGTHDLASAKMIYEGCSGGGRQALIEAQRFPDLFDGIVARAPANAYVPQFLWYQKVTKQLAQPGAGLSVGKVQALASAVLEKCDALDGLKDGVIGRPDACTFDVSSMRCTGADTDSCLTDLQIQSVKAIYEPTNVAQGRYNWPGWSFGGGEDISPDNLQAWGGGTFAYLGGGFMNYMVTQDPSVNWLDVDPTQYTFRLDYLVDLIDATNPDLSRFKARGGKLLLWHGLSDWLINPQNTTDYYSKVVAAAGGQANADEFVEYFTAPGVDHCANIGKGTGADTVDLVGPMFDWIEKGTKPSTAGIVATQSNPASGAPAKLRPLCKFPAYAKYNGTGDANLAASFVCTQP